MKTIDELRELYEKYKGYFDGSFHNLLWQLMINEVHADRERALTAVIDKRGYQLGLVLEGMKGYIPTLTWFKPGMKWEECSKIADELSEKIFEIDYEKQNIIVLRSM